MKSAVIQMVSSENVEDNLQNAQALIERAAKADAELVILPEFFCAIGKSDQEKIGCAEDIGNGPIQKALSSWAKAGRIWLLGGTIPTKANSAGKVRNTATLWSPNGQLAASYDKIHLFDFSSEEEHHHESKLVEAGHNPVVATLRDRAGCDWRLGLSICYDLRFPELYRNLCQQEVDILAVPSAFTCATGQAHWEVLLRARAIENQCWLLAAAQGGKHPNGRETWGHSMVVDPWGNINAQAHQPGPQIVYSILDQALLKKIRRQLPALEHRVL